MREFRLLVNNIDRYLEDAARAQAATRGRAVARTFRPVAMRLFAARTAKLHGSRALLKLRVEELYPDDLFTEFVGRTTTPGHHDADCSARLEPVKALRFAPTPYGLTALTGSRSSRRTALT
jgi:hypothetical protein